MRWRGRRTSSNIEDRRGRRTAVAGAGGLGVVAIVIIGALFGVDLKPLLQGGTDSPASGVAGPNTVDDQAEEFVAVVLADTEEIWSSIFTASGRTYEAPALVLYSGTTPSACGTASAAVGPFYCPGDRKIFLDTDFFAVLSQKLGAGGDFARAYVIAHEVAHHVQNLLGTLGEVTQAQASAGETGANRLQVRIELQADCYAGVWARQAAARFGSIEPGDIDEALNAASQIGDDALQKRAQGYVVPDSFTHGTSAQRREWFDRGWRTGDPSQCNTFSARDL